MLQQRIAYAPDSQLLLARGVERLNRLLSLTLGPTRGRIAVQGASAADLLDDAALLNKQLPSFGDSVENAGHQCLRGALEQLYGRTQDGIATSSVLTHAILSQVAPLLAFGHHPVVVQRQIRAAHQSARDELRRHAWSIESPAEIAAVLHTANVPPDLAAITAEIVDSIGPDGTILIEETRQNGLAREYIRGGRWNRGVASPSFLGLEPNQVNLRSPLVLITDRPLTAVADVVAVLEIAAGAPSLLLIAPSFSDHVVSVLLANRRPESFESIVAVKAPHSVLSGSQQLEDIALMTGGRFLPKEDVGALRAISREDLGRAERAWASRSAFGLAGGGGEPDRLRARAAELRALARGETDPAKRTHFSTMAGNLAGLSALVRVGTGTPGANTTRQVERAAAIARAALADGVVEGGGVALARAGQFAARASGRSEDQAGAIAFGRALAAPMSTILKHAGREPGPLLDRLSTTTGVFDVTLDRWVDARETTLADPLAVVEGALDAAVSTALMVLSTDVLIAQKGSV